MVDLVSDSRATAFSKAVQWLLRPLVRALIAQGVTALALYQVIKRIYVEVAEEELARAGEKPTDSRINVLTGVHRRDIRAFRTRAESGEAETRRKVTIIATVLGRWLGDPATTDAEGRARPLPRSSDGGASFDALVEGVSRDIRPRAVLDELTRQGLVAIDPESGLIELRAEAFFGPADLDQRVHFFAANLGDHIAAATGEPPRRRAALHGARRLLQSPHVRFRGRDRVRCTAPGHGIAGRRQPACPSPPGERPRGAGGHATVPVWSLFL
jgi:hypothetical protein